MLQRTPQPDLAELAKRVSQSAIFRLSDEILQIAPRLPPLADEREPIVTAVAEPPAQAIIAASPAGFADEARRARNFVTRNPKNLIYVERGSDGQAFAGGLLHS